MKWGVRKDRSEGVTRIKRLLSRKKVKALSDEELTNFIRRANLERKKDNVEKVKLLSDEELSAYIRRANLEKQYLDITSPKKSAGRKAIENVITTSAKSVATKYTTKYLDNGVAAFELYLRKKKK